LDLLMRIGALRGLLTIQREVQVGVDKVNAPVMHWQDWRPDVFCEVEVRRGKEQFDTASKQRYSEEVWRFRTRYDEIIGIDNSMRVLHEGSTFDIKAVLPDGHRHIDCVIECTLQDSVLAGKPLAVNIRSAIPTGQVGEPYSLSIEAQNGAGPYTFALATGVLPAGVAFDPLTGVISGTPLEAGEFPVVVKVTDSTGDEARLPSISIIVEPA
jgi:SPP1 family predicted phage head-tail adaptor